MLSAIATYAGLTPKLDSYIYETGEEENLIALEGTIPIHYRRANYHIPVCIYLRKDHPESPPICYVRPTSQMTIRESRNVDSQGKVFVPYLANWGSNHSELQCLIQVMVMTFSETPPVYKKPEVSMSQSASNSSMQSNRTGYPTSRHSLLISFICLCCTPNIQLTRSGSRSSFHTTDPYPGGQYPFSTGANNSGGYYPSTYDSNANSYPQSNSNTISEAHIRASLLSAAGDKLKERLREKLETYRAEIDVLKKTGDDLQGGTKQLDQIILKMETDISLLDNTKSKLEEKDKKLNELIAKYESAEKDFNVDDVYGPNEPIYKQ